MTPNRALLLSIPVLLAVETGIFYALAALGANGQTVVTAEMIWLCVAVALYCLFVGHFEDEESDHRGD